MPRLPLWLKIGWTIWLLVWAPLYWRQFGLQNFLFFCDLGNVLIGIGLWLESPLIFSWTASGLLLFQTIYTVDLAGALLTGRHLIGGTEYMFDPHLPLVIRLVSLFHLVTPPLLLWAIWRLGYDSRGWKLQTLMAWIVVPIKLFLASPAGCELGAGPVLSRAARDPGMVLSIRLSGHRTAVSLFPYPFVSELAQPPMAPE